MKEWAIKLLELAAVLYRPVSDLLHAALDNAPPEHASLADEIRARLPERSKAREALDALDAKENGR